MGFYQFKQEQLMNTSLEKAWEFMSNPSNLKLITPDYMGFEVTSEPQEKMYEGMIISYKISPILNIKTTWVTEITHVKENKFFVDEQRVGPYKIWHHQHHLEETEDGKVLMKDIISYQPPMGILGSIANTLLINSKLKEIFDYRTKKVDEIFNS